MLRPSIALLSVVLVASFAFGCRSAPELRRTGYLSDYSGLEQIDGDRWYYRDPSFRKDSYPRAILDPIEVKLDDEDDSAFTDEEIHEIVAYTKAGLRRALVDHFLFADEPGPGIVRVRLSLTGLQKSETGKNKRPISRLIGSGRGGAAFEAEIVDAETGAQIIAAIGRATPDDFWSTSGYSTLSDIKTAVDQWAEGFDARMREWKNDR